MRAFDVEHQLIPNWSVSIPAGGPESLLHRHGDLSAFGALKQRSASSAFELMLTEKLLPARKAYPERSTP
jgi:hypothetical protein